jgi:UDP-N-acetylglucosamine diphosphorylase/glucosamine-1-phosphate N-acetyltransferase
MRENLVITIMAAGEGKRMNSPLPKVLNLLQGQPMLVRILLEIHKLEPEKIVIITGKHHDLIIETINKYVSKPLLDHLQEITYFVQQDKPQGTGDAIKCALDYYNNDSNVLILNGDMPLITADLLSKFIDSTPKQTPSLMVAEMDSPYGYGRILYDHRGEFKMIREEKDCSPEEKKEKIVNVGIYYFLGHTLKTFIPKIENKNAQGEYYLTDIVGILREYYPRTTINTYLVDKDERYQIYGVNTQDELRTLESVLFFKN